MYKTIQYKSLCDFFERGTKEQYTSDEIIEAVCPERRREKHGIPPACKDDGDGRASEIPRRQAHIISILTYFAGLRQPLPFKVH